MSKMIYPERLQDTLCFTLVDMPLIRTSEQINSFWAIHRYLVLKQAWRLLTPKIYRSCDKEVIEKILQEDNEYLSMILHESLQNIDSYLDSKSKRFRLGVYLSKEPEVPEWKGFTILINIDYKDFDEKMALWKGIENKITEIFARFQKHYPESLKEIERASEIIATTIQKPPK